MILKKIGKKPKNINMKIPNKNIEIRLFICHNKDLLGMKDCCDEGNISFVTARCISTSGFAYALGKNTLEDLRMKFPKINQKISIAQENKEKVMVDRLINAFQTNMMGTKKNIKKEELSASVENKRVKLEKETIKYHNLIFGNNKNSTNNLLKSSNSITNNYRIRSALSSANFDEIINNKKDDDNKLIKDSNENNNESIKESNIDFLIKSENDINKNKMRSMSAKKTCIQKIKPEKENSIEMDNSSSIEEYKRNFHHKMTLQKDNTKERKVSTSILELTNNKNLIKEYNDSTSKSYENEINIKKYSIKNKITEIMKCKSAYVPKDQNLILKLNTKLNKVSNEHTEKKLICLYSPINQIIKREYSNLFNWIGIHDSNTQKKYPNSQNEEKNEFPHFYKEIKNPTFKRTKSSQPKSKILLYNKNTLPLNNKRLNIKRKTSRKLDELLVNVSTSIFKNKTIKNCFKKNRNSAKKKLGTLELIKQKDIDNRKYMKQILGARYKERDFNCEEVKIKRLMSSYQEKRTQNFPKLSRNGSDNFQNIKFIYGVSPDIFLNLKKNRELVDSNAKSRYSSVYYMGNNSNATINNFVGSERNSINLCNKTKNEK